MMKPSHLNGCLLLQIGHHVPGMSNLPGTSESDTAVQKIVEEESETNDKQQEEPQQEEQVYMMRHYFVNLIGSVHYTVTSALTPDGGLINGFGALSQGKHLRAGQTFKFLSVIDCLNLRQFCNPSD